MAINIKNTYYIVCGHLGSRGRESSVKFKASLVYKESLRQNNNYIHRYPKTKTISQAQAQHGGK